MSHAPNIAAPAPVAPRRGDLFTGPTPSWVGAVLLGAIVAAVFWPALKGEFVWDDLLLVKLNPLAQGEFTWRSVWFQTDFPLSTVALWLQFKTWGTNPLGYHAVNLLLHALDAWLVWRVLIQLGARGAFLAALLFAVHPLTVASAGWISELKNTLSLTFFLLSLLAFLKFENAGPSAGDPGSPSGTRTSGFGRLYWLSLGLFLLALLSKTSTVMLPVVLLGCAWWRHGRIGRTDWLGSVPFFALALALGLMSIWFQKHQAIGDQAVQTEDLWGRLAGAGWALWFYLSKALAPVSLCLIYPRWQISAQSPTAWLPLLAWVALLGACWRWRRGWGRPALFALGCFTVTLFPVLGFFDMYFLAISRVSDHFVYLPLIPVVALVAAAVQSLPRRTIALTLAALVLAALSALTWQRARVFASDERLWLDTAAKNPASWNAHNNLGCIRAEQGRLDEAMQYFERSLEFNPRNAQAHVNLGRGRFLQGRAAEAEAHFNTALKLNPGSADAHAQYGMALAEQRRLDEAIAHLREAMRLRPTLEVQVQLAQVLRAAGRDHEAIEQCRAILAVNPDSVDALGTLAWLLATSSDATLRDGAEAVQLAQRAVRLTANQNPRMVGTLAVAYAENGQFDLAISTSEEAIRIATAAGDSQFAAINRQLLQLFQAGRPYHEKPRPPAP